MTCTRCQMLPSLSEERGGLLLTSVVRELVSKLGEFLDARSVTHDRDDMVIRLRDLSLVDFLVLVRDSGAFNRIEQRDILVLRLDEDEIPTFHTFTLAKSLERWLGLLSARELVEMIDRKRFVSWFQPILAARDGELVGHEALVRGVRMDGSLMFPGDIFAMAGENELLFQVDRLARISALRCAAANKVSGRLFINFVPTAIYDPAHCLRTTVKWAGKLGFDPNQIVFEVVETEKVDEVDHLKRILDFYRECGYRVALDDFGSGYASLKLLALLKPDIIKVDMDMVRGIHADERRQSIFKALVKISRDLGIEVLAEGIETEAELEYVASEGADLVQGYLFGRPAATPTAPAAVSFWS